MNRYGDWPPHARPRRVEGGIKAQTKRGAFAERWWAKRWLAVLESFELGTRLTRGRAYARKGQVVDIALEPGGVRATVQGSRPEPYAVTIAIPQLASREWRAVGAAIAADTRLSAMLLAGEMPEDIESAFAAAGAALFPKTQKEITTACSCPDWSNPCKHVAAVYYLIGEEFDRDPFLLFVVRGLSRDGVRELLAPPEPPPEPPAADSPATAQAWPARPVVAPAVDAVLLRKAGRFPFWRAEETLEDALSPVYARGTETALAWLAEHPES